MSGEIYTDQPGHFPVKSNNGRKCGMLLYDYDSSFILEDPQRLERKRKFYVYTKKLHKHWTVHGLVPALQRLENQFLVALKEFMRAKNMTFNSLPLMVTIRIMLNIPLEYGSTILFLALPVLIQIF